MISALHETIGLKVVLDSEMMGSTEHFNNFLKHLRYKLPPIVCFDNMRRVKVTQLFRNAWCTLDAVISFSGTIWIYRECWSSMVIPHLIGACGNSKMSIDTRSRGWSARRASAIGTLWGTSCDCWQSQGVPQHVGPIKHVTEILICSVDSWVHSEWRGVCCL